MNCINISNPKIKELVDIYGEVMTSKILDNFTNNIPTVKEAKEYYNPILLQKESKQEAPINEQLDTILTEFLSSVGYTVSQVDTIKTNTGQDANALTNTLLKIVQVAKGKAKIDTLSEEAAHVMVELLGESNPLVIRMMSLIESTEIYKQVVEEYSEDYNSDTIKLKKEAVGKLIAQMVVNKHVENTPKTLLESFWRTFLKMLDKLSSIFKNASEVSLKAEIDKTFGYAADKLLSKDITDLSNTSIPEEVFYQKTTTKQKSDIKKAQNDPIEVYIRNYNNAIKRLQKQLKGDVKHDSPILARINGYQELIENLGDKRSFDLIISQSEKQIKATNTFIEQFDTLTVKERELLLQTNLTYVDSVSNLNKIIPELADTELNKRKNELASEAQILHKKLIELAKIHFSQVVGGNAETLTESVKDDFILTSWFLDSSRSNNPLIRKFTKFLKNRQFKANESIEKYYEEWNKLEKEANAYIKANGITMQQFLDIFKQKNSAGKWTGNYVGEFQQAWYDKKRSLKSAAIQASINNDPNKNVFWKNYYRWLNANSVKVVDIDLYEETLKEIVKTYTDSTGVVNNEAITQWIAKYNPTTGTYSDSRFIEWQPRPDLWTDSKYTDIKGTDKAPGKYTGTIVEEVYDFLTEVMQESRRVLPLYHFQGLPSNYMPEIMNNSIKELLADGMSGLYKNLSTKFKDAFKENVETANNAVEDEMGIPEKTIPVYMMSNSLGTNKSDNIFDVMRVFGSQLHLYEFKSDIENVAKIARLLVNNTDKEGEFRKDGTIRESKDGLVYSLEMLDNFINSLVYDNRKDRTLDIDNTEDNTKKVTIDKVGDNLIWYTGMVQLGLNIFSGFSNLTFGLASNMVHAAGSEDFTESEALKAFGYTMTTIGNNITKDNIGNKLNLLYKYFQLDNSQFDERKKGVLGGIQKFLMIFQERTEKFNQIHLLTSVLLNKKVSYVENGETKTISILDGFEIKDGKLYWNSKYGNNPLPDYSEAKSNLAYHIKELSKKIHGNYDYSSPIGIKRKLLGRMLMVFRNWIPEGINNRFEVEREDEVLGRTVKGRYRSYATLFKEKSIGGFAMAIGNGLLKKITFGLIKNNKFDTLSKVDKANMEKNIAELMLLVTLLIFAALLKGMSDDDDRNESIAKFLIAQNIRLEADLLFYVSPGAAMSTLRNVLPVGTTIYNLWRLIPDSIYFIYSGADDEIPTGPFAGESKLKRTLGKDVPGLNQVLRILEFDDLGIQSISGRSNIL